MKYSIDTLDKTKGSFPEQVLTEEQFFAQFDSLRKGGGGVPGHRTRSPR